MPVQRRITDTTAGGVDRHYSRGIGRPWRHCQGPGQGSSVTARELDLVANELTHLALRSSARPSLHPRSADGVHATRQPAAAC
jgi:hypothetical protein